MKKAMFSKCSSYIPALNPFVKDGWLYLHHSKSAYYLREKSDLPNGYYEMPFEGKYVKTAEVTDDTPILDYLFKTKSTFKLPKEDIEIAKRLSLVRANDPTRPVMDFVCFDKGTAACTNAHSLNYFPVKTKESFLLKYESFFLSEDATVGISGKKTEPYQVISWGSFEVSTAVFEGKYPNYKSVIPEKTGSKTFVMTRKMINEIVEYGKKFNIVSGFIRGDQFILEDNNVTEQWTVPTGVKSENISGILMPVSFTEETKCEIAFGIKGLKNSLLDYNSMTIHFEERNRAAKISYEVPSEKPTKNLTPMKKETKKETRVEPSAKVETFESDIHILKYSEKSIVVTGEGTRAIKDKLRDAGGVWNKFLKAEDKTFKGWIFSSKKEDAVRQMLSM